MKVSELSLGAWVTFGNQLDVRGAVQCMSAARDAGVRFDEEGFEKARAEALKWVDSLANNVRCPGREKTRDHAQSRITQSS